MKNSSQSFVLPDFLLRNNFAIDLYEKYAAKSPILDYHNHLSPKDVAENRKFSNLTEAWLDGDHYKWRAMRINGIDEKYCTGNGSPFEKFSAWAQTVPHTLLNPLYHWTHLELKNYFEISSPLNERTAEEIYQQCNSLLQQDNFRTQALLNKMNVKVICTTDDPIDGLEFHKNFSLQASGFNMYPTFRPDKAYAVDDLPIYNSYLDLLGDSARIPISNFDDLLAALQNRIEFFDALGCRASDHGLSYLHFDDDLLRKAPLHFKKVRAGSSLNQEEGDQLRSAVLFHLGKMYHKKRWVQQFHLGALRNTNQRMLKKIGRDTGFDSIGDFSQAHGMARFLDSLDQTDQLTKTIIYNLNSADNDTFAAMVGNFSDGSVPGKIQWGSAWWFNDQKDGIEKQLRTLSNMSLLSRFVGMVTDSRSFLSFSRHEYFRRLLCNFLGTEMKSGNIPSDLDLIGPLVERVCYSNAKAYFRF